MTITVKIRVIIIGTNNLKNCDSRWELAEKRKRKAFFKKMPNTEMVIICDNAISITFKSIWLMRNTKWNTYEICKVRHL